jgi:hypothetical protein
MDGIAGTMKAYTWSLMTNGETNTQRAIKQMINEGSKKEKTRKALGE